MAVIYEPVELSKCDMGINAHTLLETLLRFSMLVNSYKHGNGAKLLDYGFCISLCYIGLARNHLQKIRFLHVFFGQELMAKGIPVCET
jgi:hypothetical protein